MKKFILFLILASTGCFGQVQLSEEAKISVITLGPWQGELYTAFGHSAFRVHDPINHIDDAYNYGVFDFDQPNFYLNFAKGYLYYKLGTHRYPDFEYYYIYNNRYIHEQILNLTPPQKQKLFDYLRWNAKPENQHYVYDYFFNNCATKIRDVVQTVFKDSVKFDGSYVTTDYSIRELTDIYLEYQPWGDLGIDIGLGKRIDERATPSEYMFLPDYIESGFAHASINQNGNIVPLVKTRISIYEAQPETFKKGIFRPLYVFSAVFLIVAFISYRDFKSKKLSMALDGFFFAVLGFLGVCLTLLWFATDHHSTARNFNLLWALPAHVIAVAAFIWQPKWLKFYFLIVGVLSLLLLIGWPALPQNLNESLIPLVMTIALRSFMQYRLREINNEKL
jgi:hypothetical protein